MLISRLTSVELDATRGDGPVVVNGVTYRYVGERKGVRAYCGSDSQTILGITEEDAGARCTVICVDEGERWVFGDTSPWALAHITYAIERTYSCVPARA